MKGIQQSKATLIREITAAFDGVSREDGVTLHETQAIDDYEGPEMRAECRKLDTEIRWQDVPAEWITHGDSALSFLDPKGFHYYLPAFLIWYLTSEEESNTYDSVVFHLMGIYRGDYYDFSWFSEFTPEQSQSIAHFCVYGVTESKGWEAESNEWIRIGFLKEGWSEDEIRIHLKKCRPRNNLQIALNRYWHRFL